MLAQTSSSSATGLPTRVLGKTGQRVSIICLGGGHIGRVEDSEATRIMHAAIDEGINFFDNAWDYNDGDSEIKMGKALAMDGRRNKVFLMTKNCERDYKGSLKCLEECLRRLNTDRVDLWQFHEMVYDNDPDWVFDYRYSRLRRAASSEAARFRSSGSLNRLLTRAVQLWQPASY